MGEILRIEDHRRRKPVTLHPSPPDTAELATFFQDFEKILEAYYILAQSIFEQADRQTVVLKNLRKVPDLQFKRQLAPSIFEQADQQTVVLKNLQMVSDALYGHLPEV